MVKFSHVADTHLGKRNFKLKEREEDFEKAFSEVIDISIAENVDFVVHSGDLFDIPRPRISTIVETIKQLKKLKEKNIPFFVIPGSHDTGIDGTLITALEKVDLVKNLGANRYYEPKDGKIVLHGDTYKGFFIAGVPGRRANIEEIFSLLEPEQTNAKFKIFMFHHSITDVCPSFGEIKVSLIPKGFNYYAGGHWHYRRELEYNGAPLIYPGPTEFCDTNEMEKEDKRGFYIVEEKENKLVPRFVELSTRNVIFHEIKCNGLTPNQVVEKCLQKIKPDEKGSMLLIKITGRLSEGKRVDIDRTAINDFVNQNKYLYVKLDMSDLMDPFDKTSVNITGKTLGEIEHEFLKTKGYDDNTTNFAKELVETLGADILPLEVEERISRITKKLEEDYIENQKDIP